MKHICYFDEKEFDAMSQSEQDVCLDECFVDEDGPRKNKPLARGEMHECSAHGVTLRRKRRRLPVTDGPYAETKEQLGGFRPIEVIKMVRKAPDAEPLAPKTADAS